MLVPKSVRAGCVFSRHWWCPIPFHSAFACARLSIPPNMLYTFDLHAENPEKLRVLRSSSLTLPNREAPKHRVSHLSVGMVVQYPPNCLPELPCKTSFGCPQQRLAEVGHPLVSTPSHQSYCLLAYSCFLGSPSNKLLTHQSISQNMILEEPEQKHSCKEKKIKKLNISGVNSMKFCFSSHHNQCRSLWRFYLVLEGPGFLRPGLALCPLRYFSSLHAAANGEKGTLQRWEKDFIGQA